MQDLRADVDDWLTLKSGSETRFNVYRRLRREAPVFALGPNHLLSRHADCSAVLRDHKRFLSGFDPDSPQIEAMRRQLPPEQRSKYEAVLAHQLRWLTSNNAEKHVALRTLATRVFSLRAIEQMRERVQQEIDTRLDELAGRDTVEIIADFAYQLPLTIISEMLDIPVEVRESIHHSWQSMTKMIGNPIEVVPDVIDEVHAGMAELEARLRQTFALRRGQQTTDLLKRMLDVQEDESVGLSEQDVMGIVAQMVIAGHQTTQDTIGNALFELLTHREQWERLVDDQAGVADAVEEVLRYRTPGQMIGRVARDDCEIAGTPIAAGTRVTCLLGSANRDEAVFADADRFEIGRADARQHLAFSSGVHFCLGASLSRLEVTSFLTAFARRFPNAQLLSPEPNWIPNSFLLGLRELHVRLH
jgi:cytochrome P450